MTRSEAITAFLNSIPRDEDLTIRNVRRSVDRIDEIVWWTCDVIDTGARPGGCAELVAHAQFPEHWPEVEVSWV